MNKLELVEHIATTAELTKVSAAEALEAMLGGIEKTLKKGEEVRLVGFGTFSVRERSAGKGRNPATGQGNQDLRLAERPLQARREAQGGPQQEAGQEVTGTFGGGSVLAGLRGRVRRGETCRCCGELCGRRTAAQPFPPKARDETLPACSVFSPNEASALGATRASL